MAWFVHIISRQNRTLFTLAVQDWKLPMDAMYMVGDDLDGDIGGANSVGMKSVLVQTGKFRQEQLEQSPNTPLHIIPSVAELPELLNLR